MPVMIPDKAGDPLLVTPTAFSSFSRPRTIFARGVRGTEWKVDRADRRHAEPVTKKHTASRIAIYWSWCLVV